MVPGPSPGSLGWAGVGLEPSTPLLPTTSVGTAEAALPSEKLNV